MKKDPKTDLKVQKETSARQIQFQPTKTHKRKITKQSEQGYISSLKDLISRAIFQKQQSSPSRKQSHQKRSESTKNNARSKSKQKPISPATETATQEPKQTRRKTDSIILNIKKIKVNETPETTKPVEINSIQQSLPMTYLKIKYIKKVGVDSVLIGNQNQLDFLVFKIEKFLPCNDKKWSLKLQQPIEGVAISNIAQSKILLWTTHELHIYECNPKNLSQQPHFANKITSHEAIFSVQFIKRNIFIICFHSHVQIYEMTEMGKQLTINRLEIKQFTCPKDYEVVGVPELFDNNIKIFFANMFEYDNAETKKVPQKTSSQGGMFGGQKKEKNEKKQVFGLYFVEVEYDYCNTKVSEIKKVYDIKKDLRQQIKLVNISANIFFMSLKTEVLAVKNGLIIDSVGVNFKFDNCYIKLIKKDVLVHVLADKIEFYHMKLNYDYLPQKFVVKPYDSIYFTRKVQDEFLSIVPINQGYLILFQADLKCQNLDQLKAGHLNYWYALTYPIPLQQKLNQIFPSTDKIALTSFEELQTLCDMAGKMGLTENQAYRELWRKSKKQSEKDYQILLASKDYKIIQTQITTLLKKRAQKFRLIIKNEQTCLQFLRGRIFEFSCSLQNLQEFSFCHFFNMKLNCYKEIEVERRRFEAEVYKARQTGVEQISKLMQLIKEKSKQKAAIQMSNPSPKAIGQIEQKEGTQFMQRQQSNQNFIADEQQQNFIQQQQSQILQDQAQQINDGNEAYILKGVINQKQPAQPKIYATFLRTSKRHAQVQQDRKTAQVRERQKIIYEYETKQKQVQPNEVKIDIKSYYFFRDCNLKQLFLQTVANLMSKQHTFNDHLKYYSLRALVTNFKLSFRAIYEDILCQLITIYKHKVTRLLEHYIELMPFHVVTFPEMTDPALCLGIWNPIQNRELDQCLFLSDITTIENSKTVEKFKETLWFKRNYLTHHGVVAATRDEIKQRYSEQNMRNMSDHYFYLFISKFLQIKKSLNQQLQHISETHHPKTPSSHTIFLTEQAKLQQKLQVQKKQAEAKEKVLKELRKTNQLLRRIEQVYPLIPEHLKGFIELYFDLYNFLEGIQFEEKPYASIYDFLKLRDYELFKMFFTIQKKIKGFIIKQILVKYQNSQLVNNGRAKFIQGIEHYFDSPLSQITDLKTILNRLNGQTCEFHIQFEALYDCLLSAIMKKIRVSPSTNVKLDQLLIYIQNIPFSTANGKIFQKLLMIQQVHLEMDTLKRSGMDMSILEIKHNPEQVISALVYAELKSQQLILNYPHLRNVNSNPLQISKTSSVEVIDVAKSQEINIVHAIMIKMLEAQEVDIESLDQLKMYFYKCVSELLCIKRHFYGDSYEHLVGFIFVTELMEKAKLVPLIQQALEDPDIKQLLSIKINESHRKFTKSIVYYSYRRRLSKHPYSYLYSEQYLRSILRFLPKNDHQRLLIEQQLKYCRIFKKCDYNVPYPLSFKKKLPTMDEIEYHITQISSEKIDQLDVAKLFDIIEAMRELIQPCLNISQRSLDQRVMEFKKVLYEFVFFKYLSERKIQLALNMIDKIILLNIKQNCIIYDIYLIDVIVEKFSKTTSDLIIKLISYYYDQAKQLRDLLQQLIFINLTTSEQQTIIRDKINAKIQSNSYPYFDPCNYLLSDEVQDFLLSDPSPQQKHHLCLLFDAVYKHLQKSAEYISKQRYYHIIYRIMLINPYLAAQFIFSKHKNTNIKALRGFFSYMSQEFVFNPFTLIKASAIIFVIMLQRMKQNFLISQQIKEYEKLNLNQQTIDQAQFQETYNKPQSLNQTQKLIFDSYLAMKAKLNLLDNDTQYIRIENQLRKVKKVYDKDLFLIKKNKVQKLEKHQPITYLPYQEWTDTPKLYYYLDNISEFASYALFAYCFNTCDKDDEYVTKGINEFEYPRISSWPDKVQFDKIHERHQILVKQIFTRIPADAQRCHIRHADSFNDNNNNLTVKDPSSKRLRKGSDYLPQQFELQRKQNSSSHHYNSSSGHMHRMNSKSSLKDSDQTPKKQLKRTYSNELSQKLLTNINQKAQPQNIHHLPIFTNVLPPIPKQKKLNSTKPPNQPIQTNPPSQLIQTKLPNQLNQNKPPNQLMQTQVETPTNPFHYLFSGSLLMKK